MKGLCNRKGTALLFVDKLLVNNMEPRLIEEQIAALDGFLLGDGCIYSERKVKTGTGRLQCSLEHKEFCEYMMTPFANLGAIVKEYKSNNTKRGFAWFGSSKYSEELGEQHRRWYEDTGTKYFKRVPKDIRLTSHSIMLWYLGDGSLVEPTKGSVALRISTDGFLKEDVEMLAEKMCELGIQCHRNGDNRVWIEARGIPKFFEFIGRKSPVECYSYKFDLPAWRFEAKRMSEVADELGITYNKLSYWTKIGRVPCLRENKKAKPRFMPKHIKEIAGLLEGGSLD